MWSVAPKSMTHVEEDERKHVLVLPNSASVEMKVDVNLVIFDNEQTEIFDFILQLPTILAYMSLIMAIMTHNSS